MINWNKLIKEIIDRTEFMALASSSPEGNWVCPVQFSYDESMNLYFKSMPKSKHMEYIQKNPDVAIAIFSTNRFPDENVAGIQLKGKAQILVDKNMVEIATKYHYKRNESEVDYKTKVAEHLGKEAEWNFVKITPIEIWCFDTRHFGEERQRVSIDQLLLKVK